MNIIKTLTLTLLFALALTACGGGGGGGSPAATGLTYKGLTAPVAIDVDNAEVISSKTAEASQEALAQDTALNANPFGISFTSENSTINPVFIDIARTIANNTQSLNLPVGSETLTSAQLGPEFCGGTVTADDTFINSPDLNGSITMNNLCYIDPSIGQIVITGTLSFTETASSISMRFINITINDGANLSSTINMTVTCNTSSCSVSAVYTGDDGKIYQITDMTVTGSTIFTVSATFYHPDHGSISISGTGLTYGCPGGLPDSGTITFTGAGSSSGSIVFRNNCTGYDGTYNDGVSSGIFSGNWL